MSRLSFNTLFQSATGNTPYDYQSRLAGNDSGTACRSQLISIPTGLGKTAAVVLAWLWNRVHLQNPEWPRRLVYCLPMRTLVEQTETEVRKWLLRLARKHTKPRDGSELRWLALHSPVILMGGEAPDKNWDIHPEKPAILIGTQDMLLSRALNRGYGMSRYRWPMHFGLLNNDALWVMDETQLMGVGVETSAQLDGFRRDGKMPTVGVCPTWWMSATLDKTRLDTVDHREPDDGWNLLALSPAEQSGGRPHELITAKKKLSPATLKGAPAPFVLNAETKNGYAKQLAAFISERHHPGTLTLVVVNRVQRAREIFQALTTSEKKGKQTQPPLYAPERVALIHSRFRKNDRKKHEDLLFGKGDRIVIATQAVEAGVDVSARLLVTELAPWSSLVQRMGRCNRRADISDAEARWVNIEPDAKGELLLPYSKEELDQARTAIAPITDASPRALREIKVEPKPLVRPVIRRRDLVDLFDTTPDLCGQDLDISRYIRDGDDNDVQFFWRDIAGEKPDDNESAPQRKELCRVSIGDAAKFLGKKPRAWRWNPLTEEWENATTARPGAVYLVDAKSGGYCDTMGWTGDPKNKPAAYPPPALKLETYSGNRLSFDCEWQTLATHTAHVVKETLAIVTALSLDDALALVLRTAVLWHDVGKAHACFQAMLRLGPHQPADPAALYAKSKNRSSMRHDDKTRRGFRHELASALAWLLAGPHDAPERDLVAYLIAAHHGKVRLSIRSLPNEPAPDGEDRLFARGIWQGDTLPAVSLGEITTPEVILDLSFMKMGEGPHGPSWLARAVALRDRLGPFQLAYLETMLRAADATASANQTSTR